MLVKQDVFFWWCGRCGYSGEYCWDQSKMNEEELQHSQDDSNSPNCPECGAKMIVEV